MVHVKVWSGSRTARIIDMTNAGKIGKRCSTLRISGASWSASPFETEDQKAARQASESLIAQLEGLGEHVSNGGQVLDYDFEMLTGAVLHRVNAAHAAGSPESYLNAFGESIKGIHAPRRPLTAGVEGKWSAIADESGISMRQLDDVNEWSQITRHGQTGPQAYKLAAKVWDRVKQCSRMGEAAEILRAAGCKLHGYCAMD